MATGIEWTDETWNPFVGCSVVSPGCTNCYAMKMAARLEAMSIANEAKTGGDPGPLFYYRGLTKATRAGAVWTGEVVYAGNSTLHKPYTWKKPRKVFVNSMSDLFHEEMSDASIDLVFQVMAETPQHTYQILTKRPERMYRYMQRLEGIIYSWGIEVDWADWPLKNVWLGVSVEDQKRADERIPFLLKTSAAVRFLSCEPLLGPIGNLGLDGIDWIIVGGESGPGARPMHPRWARSIRDQCVGAGVPFFMKQMSGTSKYGMPKIPTDLQIRQEPKIETR